MTKNQLFKKIPDKEVVLKLLNAFGFHSFNDNRNFSRKDLSKLNTVDIVNELRPILEKYYLPCKSRTYLSQLNEKNIITILRQCLRTHGYTINSREKYLKGEKFIIYNICNIEQKTYRPISMSMDDISTVVNFD
jgi:hypothetical protein